VQARIHPSRKSPPTNSLLARASDATFLKLKPSSTFLSGETFLRVAQASSQIIFQSH
jgi:hypothetical protein